MKFPHTHPEQIHYLYCTCEGAVAIDQSSWSQAIICTKLFLEMKESLTLEDDYLSIYLTASHCCYTCPAAGRDSTEGNTQAAAFMTALQHSQTALCWDICPLNLTQNQPYHVPITGCSPDTIPCSPWAVSSANMQSQWAWEIVVENTDSSTHKLTQVVESHVPLCSS